MIKLIKLNNTFSVLTAVMIVLSTALSPIILRGEDNANEEADMKYCSVLEATIPKMKEYCSKNKCTERDIKVLDMSLKDYEKCIRNIPLSLVDRAQQYTGAMWMIGGRNKDAGTLDELGLLLVCVSDVAKKPVDLTVKKLNEFKDKYSSGDGRFAKITKKGDLQKSALRAGDVVFYLMPYSNDQELKVNKSISKLRQYIWGAGIYNGKGKIIHASSYDENYSVLEEDFESFVLRNKINMIYHFSIKL